MDTFYGTGIVSATIQGVGKFCIEEERTTVISVAYRFVAHDNFGRYIGRLSCFLINDETQKVELTKFYDMPHMEFLSFIDEEPYKSDLLIRTGTELILEIHRNNIDIKMLSIAVDKVDHNLEFKHEKEDTKYINVPAFRKAYLSKLTIDAEIRGALNFNRTYEIYVAYQFSFYEHYDDYGIQAIYDILLSDGTKIVQENTYHITKDELEDVQEMHKQQFVIDKLMHDVIDSIIVIDCSENYYDITSDYTYSINKSDLDWKYFNYL